jgi:hypothetical protein
MRHGLAKRCAQPDGVAEWRRRRLLAAGLAPEVSSWLATRSRTDLHELLELIDRGCPPALAVRILAPLEEWPPC